MIRPMSMDDIPRVAELERSNFSLPWSKESLRESLEKPLYLFLVAEEQGEVVGYGGLMKIQDEGDITDIVVNEAFRGRGIGTRLMTALLEEGEKCGICAFTLEVRVGNKEAIRIYERLGFVPAGVRKRFYEKPTEDALIMWKRKPGT